MKIRDYIYQKIKTSLHPISTLSETTSAPRSLQFIEEKLTPAGEQQMKSKEIEPAG